MGPGAAGLPGEGGGCATAKPLIRHSGGLSEPQISARTPTDGVDELKFQKKQCPLKEIDYVAGGSDLPPQHATFSVAFKLQYYYDMLNKTCSSAN